MAATKGNQFWKLRSKHGRDKLFETPDLLWEEACKYFQWCQDNPLMETQIVRGSWKEIIPSTESEDQKEIHHNHSMVDVPKMRPFTLTALCLFLNCSTEYFRHFEENNQNSEDFMPVITRIRETIYTQKFEGAAAGFLNPNIIARDLGLTDKQEIDNNIKHKLPTREEREQYLKNIRKEAASG